ADTPEQLRADPVSLAHRYPDPRDAEIAGLLAALMAYGRVTLFRPVVEAVLTIVEEQGGPRAFAEGFEPARDGAPLRPLVYRWNRGVDLVLLFSTARQVIARHGGLEPLFAGWHPGDGDVSRVLAGAIAALRAIAVEVAPACGVPARAFGDLPRGFRTFLPSPTGGSACKRWNMFLRWMVRPPTEGIDLGLWDSLPPSALVVPLDTHVLRIARLVGLTRRRDGSWRTAAEITANLRLLDPDDPVRFDFALAHLGISGACKGRRDEAVCPSCPLRPVCVA
ncbi:MAG: TIGR02757 family protein, partial [Deltaproteobacteria bacterium]|nr:TIGR02757 family protein [Deltaproteobacteria bacterium]